MKTNEPWPHNWKGHIMITFLKVIFALTQVCEPDTQHNLVLPSGRCSCRQCMASWWTAPACPRGWTRTGSGGGRGPAGALWTSSSWCLLSGRRDQVCQEDVSPETLSVMMSPSKHLQSLQLLQLVNIPEQEISFLLFLAIPERSVDKGSGQLLSGERERWSTLTDLPSSTICLSFSFLKGSSSSMYSATIFCKSQPDINSEQHFSRNPDKVYWQDITAQCECQCQSSLWSQAHWTAHRLTKYSRQSNCEWGCPMEFSFVHWPSLWQ